MLALWSFFWDDAEWVVGEEPVAGSPEEQPPAARSNGGGGGNSKYQAANQEYWDQREKYLRQLNGTIKAAEAKEKAVLSLPVRPAKVEDGSGAQRSALLDAASAAQSAAELREILARLRELS